MAKFNTIGVKPMFLSLKNELTIKPTVTNQHNCILTNKKINNQSHFPIS